jgi:CRISPR-associated endonuclease Csn1
MEKLIFGLDLGVNSVGWSAVKYYDEGVDILAMGSRIVPSDPDFHGKFYSGNSASKNAERTLKRGIRRNNQRWKARRDKLCAILKDYQMYDANLNELSSIELYGLRAKAVREKISPTELGRIILHVNQRRGFLSNRKSNSQEENQTAYKERLQQLTDQLDGKTIGQQLYKELCDNPKTRVRDRVYTRTEYKKEFDLIWTTQQAFHKELSGSPESKDRDSLYSKIATQTLFYQRPLKSVKHLVKNCRFETSLKVAPTSSPFYQLFVIYQQLNNVELTDLQTGTKRELSKTEKEILFQALHDPKLVAKTGKLSLSKIYRLLSLTKEDVDLNYIDLDGNKTYLSMSRVLSQISSASVSELLLFDWTNSEQQLMQQAGLYRLWHLLYSIPEDSHIIESLVKSFGLSLEDSKLIASKLKFSTDHGRLSTKAIKKLLPHLKDGLMYSEACNAVGYDHSESSTQENLLDELPLITKNDLRNPVVEQILNQTVNVINAMIKKYGRPEEIRIELAREMRNNAKRRSEMTKRNASNKKKNDQIKETLRTELDFTIINGRDVKRFKLWEETGRKCLYCGQNIGQTDLLQGLADTEHIIPRSRSFNDSLNNKIISHVVCNRAKNQMTARDYMDTLGQQEVDRYLDSCNELYATKKINKSKYDNLMRRGDEISDNFVNRQAQDTSYISKAAVSHLKKICKSVKVTSGAVTDYLRSEWELKHLLQELNLPKYEAIGIVENKTIKTGQNSTKEIQVIKGWSKRDDHRHHAIDALITALTDQKIIFTLNNRNKLYQAQKDKMSREDYEALKEDWLEKTGEEWTGSLAQMATLNKDTTAPPIPNLRTVVKKHLGEMLISFKKSNSKALSLSYNRIKGSDKTQITLVPRGALHEDTIRGRKKRYKKVKIDSRFSSINLIVNEELKQLIKDRIGRYNGSTKKAFSSKALKKDPISYGGKVISELTIWEHLYTKRVSVKALTAAQLKKIYDPLIKKLINDYVSLYSGDLKKAWDVYDQKPLKIHGNVITKVSVEDNGSYEPLRINHETDEPIDYVKPGNNHHALIYRDDQSVYSSRLISLYEATELGVQLFQQNKALRSVIQLDPHPDTGASCIMSLQINDLVVIDCDISLIDQKVRSEISKNMYRVQKISNTRSSALDITFRHHLETSVDKSKTTPELRGVTWEQFQSDKHFARLRKVRVDHLGNIISVIG